MSAETGNRYAGNRVQELIDELREKNDENTWCAITDLRPDELPWLIKACESEADPEFRSDLVTAVWEHRRPEDLGFLAQMLEDADQRVWEAALDGLVAIGGRKALELLREALARQAQGPGESGCKREWIEEALDQLEHPGNWGMRGTLEGDE